LSRPSADLRASPESFWLILNSAGYLPQQQAGGAFNTY
jgi:hypothetical protein